MSNSDIFEKVREIIVYVTDCSPEEIQPGSSLLSDLDMSSLEVMMVINRIEGAFSVRISEKTLRTFVCVEDIVKYIGSTS